jgi:F-type H+-transporting ATPase subunit delta
MPKAPKGKRYAEAAFDIAKEKGRIDEWLNDLQLAQEALRDEALLAYLEVPKVALDRKVRVLQLALGDLDRLALNLVTILTSRTALALLPEIVTEYRRLVDVHLNRQSAEVVTAVPLKEEQRNRLNRQLERLLGKEVVLTMQVDPEILGGLVARLGDRIVEGSTRERLRAMRKSLAEVPG